MNQLLQMLEGIPKFAILISEKPSMTVFSPTNYSQWYQTAQQKIIEFKKNHSSEF